MPIGCLFDDSRIVTECRVLLCMMLRTLCISMLLLIKIDSFSLELYWVSSLAPGENPSLL
jgi:hypothetical protein